MTAISIRDKANNVRGLIEKSRAQIGAALPRHMTAERMIRVCNTAVQKTPELLDCEPRSLIGAIVQASQLGLEPDGTLGHAYLLPFNNRKTGRKECQFIPGYKGLIELTRRSGQISTIYAHAVYANDQFRYTLGLNPTLEHVPAEGEPGELIAVYAVARLRDGGVQFEVLRKREVDAVRTQSRNGNHGPWVTHYAEMAKKTALRRLCKLLPVSPELARAVALDEQAEASVPQGLDMLAGSEVPEVIDVEPEARAPAPARLDEIPLADRIAAYIAESGTVRSLGKIGEQIDQHESEGQLTAEQADSLRTLVDERHEAIEPTAKAAANS